jgi:hypothetical protein
MSDRNIECVRKRTAVEEMRFCEDRLLAIERKCKQSGIFPA